jgi:hypothetical protein
VFTQLDLIAPFIPRDKAGYVHKFKNWVEQSNTQDNYDLVVKKSIWGEPSFSVAVKRDWNDYCIYIHCYSGLNCDRYSVACFALMPLIIGKFLNQKVQDFIDNRYYESC